MNIILVHGILGFHRLLGLEYFRGLAEHFQQFHILAPALDPTRGVQFRGNQLGKAITDAFAAGTLDPAQRTHLVAHSLGGLDSRFLLSPSNPGRSQDPVHSLTTIATPHRGSPIADVLDSPVNLGLFSHLPFGDTFDPVRPPSAS